MTTQTNEPLRPTKWLYCERPGCVFSTDRGHEELHAELDRLLTENAALREAVRKADHALGLAQQSAAESGYCNECGNVSPELNALIASARALLTPEKKA